MIRLSDLPSCYMSDVEFELYPFHLPVHRPQFLCQIEFFPGTTTLKYLAVLLLFFNNISIPFIAIVLREGLQLAKKNPPSGSALTPLG